MEKWSFASFSDCGSDAMLIKISDSLLKNADANRLRHSDILGVGIGVPGPVDAFGVVHGCINLGWKTEPVKEKLEALCQFSARVENDANLAALGECWQGAAKGVDSAVLLTLGTGVGGAIILNGTLLKGANGCAGEVGHICVFPDEALRCSCGAHGCLEQYASATGLVRLAAQQGMAEAADTSRRGLTAKAVFRAAAAGDIQALQAVDIMAKMLSRALADIAAVIDPQVFILGGGLSGAGELLRAPVQRYYSGIAFGGSENTAVKIAALQNDAGMWGGAYLFLKR